MTAFVYLSSCNCWHYLSLYLGYGPEFSKCLKCNARRTGLPGVKCKVLSLSGPKDWILRYVRTVLFPFIIAHLIFMLVLCVCLCITGEYRRLIYLSSKKNLLKACTRTGFI